jgi:hypothetical protein
MPKIPTYDQLGQRVKAPTTQIGVRADSQAFVGAQLATADLFKKAGNIAYEFGMKEKEENTKAAFAELKTQYNNEVNDVIRNSKATSTLEAENELKQFNAKFEKNYAKKNLTPNELKSIKTQMILHQGNKMQAGKNLAFDRGRDNNSTLHNNSLINLSMEISKLSDGNPLKEAMIQEAREIYTTATENGETGNLGVKTFAEFEKGVRLNEYSLLSRNAKNIGEINDLQARLEADTLPYPDRVDVENLLKESKNRVLNEYSEAISMQIFDSSKEDFLDDKLYKEKLDQILKRGKIETVNAKGQAITIDTSKLTSSQLMQLYNISENKRIRLESEELNSIKNTEISNAQNMSLSEIEQRLKDIDNGKYLPQIKNFNARQSMKNIYSDVQKKRQIEDIATAKQNTKTIVDNIGLDNGISESTNELITQTQDILRLTDNREELNNFNFQIDVATKSSAIFSTTQFSSETDKRNAETSALSDARDEKDPEKRSLKLAIYNELVKKNTNDRALFVKDPVDYLQRGLKKELLGSERISMQKTMGIVGSKLRIMSDNEIKAFNSAFTNAQTFDEKSKIGEGFISKFGPQYENLVMKNLVQRSVISKVESLMLSDPKNPHMNFIMTSNSPEQIKDTEKSDYKKTSKNGKSLMKSVRQQLEKYNNSLIGRAYQGEAEANMGNPANNHIMDTENIVYNTAALLLQRGKSSPNNAAKMAYEMVLGDSNDFFEINNKYVRVEKGLGINTEGVKGVLQFILNDKEFLVDRIVSPPEEGTDETVTNKTYVDRLASQGSWRTTVDNQSVYLIDNTGNMVRRKVEEQPTDVGGISSLVDPQSPFIVIRLDQLNLIARDIEVAETEAAPLGGALFKQKEVREEILKTKARF